MLFIYWGQIPPPFPWSDESEIAADAVATVRHGLQLFYPGQLAGGSLAVWIEAGWMRLFGKDLLNLRLLNGLINLLSALALFGLVQTLPIAKQKKWLAFTAALLFVVSTWLLGLGRIATPNWSLVPLTLSLTFWLLWQSIIRPRPYLWILAGVGLGSLFYGYLPGYLGLVIAVIFWGTGWLIYRQIEHPGRTFLWIFGTMAIVATPILIFFALTPEAILQRPLQLSDTNELEAGTIITGGLIDTLSAFGFYPDRLIQGDLLNLVFDPVVTGMFWLGFGVSLWRWRRAGYLFLLYWWLIMIIPAAVSRSASQGFIFEVWRRGVGAQPVSFIMAAIGLDTLNVWLLPRASLRLRYGISVGTAILSAGFGIWLYFGQWANSPAMTTAFAPSPVQLVSWLEEESTPDTLFIFPLRPNISPTTRPELFTVRYLYNGPARLSFPTMDEMTVTEQLRQALTPLPHTTNLMMHRDLAIDPKNYFPYALGQVGIPIGQDERLGYYITTYRLETSPVPLPSPLAINLGFGDGLGATEMIPPARPVRAGNPVSIALHWNLTTPPSADFNSSLILMNKQNIEWSRVNQPLLSAYTYQTTQHWDTGQKSWSYYTLPVPIDTPPGQYEIRVLVYNSATGALLQPHTGRGDLSAPLLNLKLQSHHQPIDLSDLSISYPLQHTFFDGLQLAGLGQLEPAAQPGKLFHLSLWWQKIAAVTSDSQVTFYLESQNHPPIALQSERQPLIVGYPLPQWPMNQPYRAVYPLRIPTTVESGDYQLTLALSDSADGTALEKHPLVPLTVEARPHKFEAIPLPYTRQEVFGNSIRLLSFDVTVTADNNLTVRLQWQSQQSLTTDYKTFLHLVDKSGNIQAQSDVIPGQGNAPTSSWVVGEIIEDKILLPLPPDLSLQQAYDLIIGLYNSETGERLPVGSSDHATLIKNGEIISP